MKDKHTIIIQNIKPEESNMIGLQVAKYVNTFGGLVSIQTDEKIFNPEVLRRSDSTTNNRR